MSRPIVRCQQAAQPPAGHHAQAPFGPPATVCEHLLQRIVAGLRTMDTRFYAPL